MNFALIEAGGTKFVCGVMSQQGVLLETKRIPTTSPEETMMAVVSFFSKYTLSAIGVGCFGPIEIRKGHPNFGQIGRTPKAGWESFNIAKALEQVFSVPVFLDTDVNVAALAEYYWGSAKGASSCLYLTVGTGIGAGFVKNGEILSGEMHPEMGHIYIKRHPEDNYGGCCPYHGDCLEGLASGTSIWQRYGKKGAELKDRPEVWTLEADYIAQGLTNYMMILSPQVIILGGGVLEQPTLFEMIRKQLPISVNGYLGNYQVKLTRPALDNNQGLFGAAALVFSGMSLPITKLLPTVTPKSTCDEPLFLKPVFQNRIWGGTRLSAVYGYEIADQRAAECWAVAAHPNGKSVVQNGYYAGWSLDALWDAVPGLFGGDGSGKFPLLTKLLDAREDLSVQVHPDDQYASVHEGGELGKTECWYVVDCKPGAELIMGHSATTKEDLARGLKTLANDEGAMGNLLNRVAIHPGDFFYVPSGTVHAIGAGTLILETQQNSDTTYRVYDYMRKDSDGQLRPLHLEKALDVIHVPQQIESIVPHLQTEVGLKRWLYLDNHYFRVEKWQSYTQGKKYFVQKRHFSVCSVLEGEGVIVIDEKPYPFKRSDHFIVPKTVDSWHMEGSFELIVAMA